MAFVELNGVSLTYRLGKETTPALADATFSIDKGEFIAVVGPSGCGKSTIMKLVTEGSTQRIVGAHILGGEAAEMIQLVAVAMTMGATKADFDATVAVHPTAAEELVTMRSAHARFEDGMEIP